MELFLLAEDNLQQFFFGDSLVPRVVLELLHQGELQQVQQPLKLHPGPFLFEQHQGPFDAVPEPSAAFLVGDGVVVHI